VSTGPVVEVSRLRKHEVEDEEVRSMCTLIKGAVNPPLTGETARLSNSRRMVTEAAGVAADEPIHVPGSSDLQCRG
jgi:hypothetical protein